LFHRRPEPAVAESAQSLLKEDSIEKAVSREARQVLGSRGQRARRKSEYRRNAQAPTGDGFSSLPRELRSLDTRSPSERLLDEGIQEGQRIRGEFGLPDPAQVEAVKSKRLNQIQLQLLGPPALIRPEIASQLAYTDEQRQSVEETLSNAQVNDWKATSEELSRILTAEQRSKWHRLIGKPFTDVVGGSTRQ
jgi:hypothetical protein